MYLHVGLSQSRPDTHRALPSPLQPLPPWRALTSSLKKKAFFPFFSSFFFFLLFCFTVFFFSLPSVLLVGGENPGCQTSKGKAAFASRSRPGLSPTAGSCQHPQQGTPCAGPPLGAPGGHSNAHCLPSPSPFQQRTSFCPSIHPPTAWSGCSGRAQGERRVRTRSPAPGFVGSAFSPLPASPPQRAELLERSLVRGGGKPLPSPCSAARPQSSSIVARGSAASRPTRHLGSSPSPSVSIHRNS